MILPILLLLWHLWYLLFEPCSVSAFFGLQFHVRSRAKEFSHWLEKSLQRSIRLFGTDSTKIRSNCTVTESLKITLKINSFLTTLPGKLFLFCKQNGVSFGKYCKKWDFFKWFSNTVIQIFQLGQIPHKVRDVVLYRTLTEI